MLLLVSLAFAQSAPETKEENVIYKAVTEIDYEGLRVEAAMTRPDGTLVSEYKRGKFNPLIVLREDFNGEMEKSATDVR